MGKYIVLLTVILSGCVGMTRDEIQRQPATQLESQRPINDVLHCLLDKTSDLGDATQVMTYPDGHRSDVSIGAQQLGSFRRYYLISLHGVGGTTKLTVQRSPGYYLPLPPDKFNSLIRRCI